MPDPVVTLARALWAQSHTKAWDSWATGNPNTKETYFAGARALLAEITPQIVAEAVAKERERILGHVDTQASLSRSNDYDTGWCRCAERIAAAIRAMPQDAAK